MAMLMMWIGSSVSDTLCWSKDHWVHLLYHFYTSLPLHPLSLVPRTLYRSNHVLHANFPRVTFQGPQRCKSICFAVKNLEEYHWHLINDSHTKKQLTIIKNAQNVSMIFFSKYIRKTHVFKGNCIKTQTMRYFKCCHAVLYWQNSKQICSVSPTLQAGQAGIASTCMDWTEPSSSLSDRRGLSGPSWLWNLSISASKFLHTTSHCGQHISRYGQYTSHQSHRCPYLQFIFLHTLYN